MTSLSLETCRSGVLIRLSLKFIHQPYASGYGLAFHAYSVCAGCMLPALNQHFMHTQYDSFVWYGRSDMVYMLFSMQSPFHNPENAPSLYSVHKKFILYGEAICHLLEKCRVISSIMSDEYSKPAVNRVLCRRLKAKEIYQDA